MEKLRVLFIGNSATFTHDIPGTLAALAGKAGYEIECDCIKKSGATLKKHANIEKDHGKAVREAIGKGHDIVFLQDNGNCVSSDEMREACRIACHTLHDAIRVTGAKTGIYVRPPYGYEVFGREPVEQCKAFDELFTGLSQELGAVNAYVNRAFAYAILHTDFDLWGPDNAHTSPLGAYLAVCVFFCTLCGASATVLEANGLPEAEAQVMQEIADKIVLEGVLPW